MPQELGMPTYYNLKETDPGTVLVSKGQYCGSVKSQKFNNMQHNFYEVDGEKRHVVLNGGQLDWRINQGDIKLGGVYDITFDGMQEISKGQWSGTKSKQFKVATYSKKEISDLVDKGAELREDFEVPKVEPIKEEVQAPSGEGLGDLE